MRVRLWRACKRRHYCQIPRKKLCQIIRKVTPDKKSFVPILARHSLRSDEFMDQMSNNSEGQGRAESSVQVCYNVFIAQATAQAIFSLLVGTLQLARNAPDAKLSIAHLEGGVSH
jgi:hypothetical protein